MSKLHLVDGTFELFRAHYSKRPSFVSRAGKPMKATTGMLSSLMMLLADPEEHVEYIAVAFDNPIRSFRNDLFPGYKDEFGVDPELLAQFDDAEQAVAALGVRVWSMKDFEADDGLASGVCAFASQVDQVRILTVDKDLNQCVVGDAVVVVDRMRKRVWNEEEVKKVRGVAPEFIPEFLALVGDSADGIPGLKGFGEKGAAKTIRAWGHFEDFPADVAAWANVLPKGETMGRTFQEHRQEAMLYRTLATLRTDAPIDASLEALRYTKVGPGFEAWCEDVGFRPR